MSDLEPLRGGWFQGTVESVRQGCPQALGTLTVSGILGQWTFPIYTDSRGLGPSLRRACLPLPILLSCLCKFEVNIPWTVLLG